MQFWFLGLTRLNKRRKKVARNEFGRCSSVFFDPTLSEGLAPMPGAKTAARRSDQLLGFSPESTDRRLVSTDQFRLPRSTNKAVNPIRRSSAGVQNYMNRNDRDTLCQNTFIASMTFFLFLKIYFCCFWNTSCRSYSCVRRHDWRGFQRIGYLCKSRPSSSTNFRNAVSYAVF